MKFFSVYILQLIIHPEHFYTGFTQNLEQRLNEHNQGKCSHTSKFIPWKIKTAVLFTDKERALKFERYLKSSSGRTFAKKRL
ncbi:GIY-YIG nuclease family protein [Candidatus Latescibacterota bacterium]